MTGIDCGKATDGRHPNETKIDATTLKRFHCTRGVP
jgi:hypothetical protein